MATRYHVLGACAALLLIVLAIILSLIFEGLGRALLDHVIERGIVQCVLGCIVLVGIGVFMGHQWPRKDEMKRH